MKDTHKTANGKLIDVSILMKILVNEKSLNVHHVCHLSCVFFYIHCILIHKDLHECQNVLINFPCAFFYICVPSGDHLTFLIRDSYSTRHI